MSFTDKVEPEEVKKVEEVVEEEVEKIKLGDEEFTHDQLKRLVDLGKIGVEAEEKYNTSLDKVWPEFGKKSNQLREYEEKFAHLEEERNKPQLPENEQQAIEEARAAARKLGLTLDEDVEGKVGAKLEKEFRNYYLREKSAERLLEETSHLEKEIDGSDGRPKFNSTEVLEFMKENPGFKKPIDAYEAKYKSETDEWRANQIVKAKKGIVTNNDNLGVDKQPPEVRVTSANLDQLIRESLNK